MENIKLTLNQFTYTTPSAGIYSPVLTYTVPIGSALRIPSNRMMSLRITAGQLFSYTSAQTSNTVTVTVAGNVAQVGNYYAQPNPALSGYGIWTNVTTSASTILYATAVSGNSITFQPNDTTDSKINFQVYYLLGSGQYKWTVNVPLATGSYPSDVFSDSIARVNSLDQATAGTALYFPRDLLLLEGYSLILQTLSTPAVSMNNKLTGALANGLCSLTIDAISYSMNELLAIDPQIKAHTIQAYTLNS